RHRSVRRGACNVWRCVTLSVKPRSYASAHGLDGHWPGYTVGRGGRDPAHRKSAAANRSGALAYGRRRGRSGRHCRSQVVWAAAIAEVALIRAAWAGAATAHAAHLSIANAVAAMAGSPAPARPRSPSL